MNKIFYRTKSLSGFLASDSDLLAEKVFYPPHVIDTDEFSINDNDPLRLGAIASKTIDGIVTLFIYQGLDVGDNEIWTKVGEYIPSASSKGIASFSDTDSFPWLIPHGLNVLPLWYNVSAPSDLEARNILNSSVVTIDDTNIIITPQFTNEEGITLNFLWKAEL